MHNFSNRVLGVPREMGIEGDFSPTGGCKEAGDEEVLHGFFSNLSIWATGRANNASFLQVIRSENFPF